MLTAKMENVDTYDRVLIQKMLGLDKIDKEPGTYRFKDSILDSLIIGRTYKKDNLKITTNADDISLIISPFIHDDKKVSIDANGEFHDPQYGVYVINIRPKSDEIRIGHVPGTTCTRNQDYVILKMDKNPQNSILPTVPLELMICIEYKSRAKEQPKRMDEKAA